MPIERNRLTTRDKRDMRDIAAAIAVLGAASVLPLEASALAMAAGGTSGVSDTTGGVQSGPRDRVGERVFEQAGTLNAISELVDRGRLIEARVRLERLANSGKVAGMSPSERSRVMSMVKDVDAKVRLADGVEMQLQRGEMAAGEGDLVQAERLGRLVLGTQSAASDQKQRAQRVLTGVEARRTELSPLVESLFAQAEQDYVSGRYASAKAGVLTLLRSGSSLDAARVSQLESYRMQIATMERQRGEAFDLRDEAGMTTVRGSADGEQAGEAKSEDPLPEVQPKSDPGISEPAISDPAISDPAAHEPAMNDPATNYPGAVIPVGEMPAADAPARTIWLPGKTPGARVASDRSGDPSSGDPSSAWPGNDEGHHDRAPAMTPSESVPAAEEPAAVPMAGWQDSVYSAQASVPAPQDDLITIAMRAEGMRLIAEADQAFDQARYAAASEKYTVALSQFKQYLPAGEITRVERRLAEAGQRLGSNTPNAGLAQNVVQSLKLQQDQARTAFNNEVEQARAKLASGDTAKAQDLLARARLSISNAKSAFSENEFEGYMKSLDDLGREIDARRETIAVDEAKKREAELKDKAQKAETGRVIDRDRKVSESIDRVRALQAERKYKEALQVIDQALFLNPNDPTALLLRDILRDLVVYEDFNKKQTAKQWGHVRQSMDNEAQLIPPIGFMEYPEEWPSKSLSRGEQGAFADTPENRRVLSAMASTKVQVDLKENRFEDVLAFIGKVSSLAIDADWDSLQELGVDKDTPVSIKLPSVSVEKLLSKVLEKVTKDEFSPVDWAVSDGVINVASDQKLRKTKSLVMYNIQDLIFEIPNYPDAPQIDLTSVLQQSQGGGGGGQSPFNNANQTNQLQTPEQLEERRRLRVDKITEILTKNVDPSGWADAGGETGAIQELNGTLIITNTPKNHREIVGLLSKLRDVRNMQINVETKFLLVNQNWFEQIGFDLDVVFNAESSSVQTARRNDPSVRPSDFFNFGNQTGGSSRGLVRQVTGQGPTGGQLGPITNAQRTNQATTAGDKFSPIGAISDSIGLTSGLAEGDFATQMVQSAPALGIAGQFLDDIQVDFLVLATQADKRSVQLTAPRLTITNGQTSNIFVVTQQAFVSDLQPVTGDSAVGFDPTVSVVSEGVTMLVEAVISSDRRYVTMNIDAGVARIDGFAQQAVTAVAGGQLVNSADTQSFIQLPTVTVTRVRTTATVPDEGTLLIGGQRLITEVEVETGVPVLSKIPIINRFFTNRLESKEEQTLLVLLKPTVLIQSEQEEKAYPGLMDSIRSGLPSR